VPTHHTLDFEQLGDYVNQQRRRNNVPGLAVSVVNGHGTIWSHADGVADIATARSFETDTTCHWFSMTKILAVTAAMHLADHSELDIDAPLADVAPGLVPDAFSAVTVRHLAQHSAGFTNPLPLRWVHPVGHAAPDQRAFVEALFVKQRAPRFTPGSTARYSNVSTMVLGEVIASVSGQPFVGYVTDHIIQPLAMTNTGFAYTPAMLERAAVGYITVPRALTPALRRFLPNGVVGERCGRRVAFDQFEMDAAACSGLIGTVTDAARFAAMHVNNGTLDGVTILQPHAARTMRDITLSGRPYDMGLGWFRSRRDRHPKLNYVEHLGGGGGFWNTMRIYPELSLAVVIMSNTTKHHDVGSLANHLAAACCDTSDGVAVDVHRDLRH
jgi:CubicO group peptidase (beta-lactamase class C family)